MVIIAFTYNLSNAFKNIGNKHVLERHENTQREVTLYRYALEYMAINRHFGLKNKQCYIGTSLLYFCNEQHYILTFKLFNRIKLLNDIN